MAFVEITSLTRRYGKVEALTDFSLSVEQGKIVTLVGPDGAGKTTLIRCICNLISPDEGTATVAGQDVQTGSAQFKEELGYMPQVFSLYPDLTVEENLIFSAGLYGITGKAYEKKRDEMYEFSRLAPFGKRRASALSGGMKQKLALSCALMHDPKLLILDEPTTGVDPLSRRQFWEILKAFRDRGVTILASTPYMDEVARADEACIIFGGRKLAEGTPDELRRLYKGKIYFANLLPSPEQVDRISQIDGVTARRFGAGMHVGLPADADLNEYRERFNAAGFDAAELKELSPDLEDCFIQLMEDAR